MASTFEVAVCKRYEALLGNAGYDCVARCSFQKSQGTTFGSLWFVRGTSSLSGRFMARLSVGLEAIGRDVAVISVDLNQLDPEGKGQWYQWKDGSEEGLARVARLLVNDAVPWLNRHTDLEELIHTLQSRAAIVPPTHRRKWWQVAAAPAAEPRVNSNNMRYLSYCYEALGRYSEAVEWWERYVSTLTLMAPGSEQAKDTEKRGQYLAARASHGSR